MQYTHIKKIITVPALVHIARVKSSPPLSGAASLPNIINTPGSTHPISSAHIPCPRPRPMKRPHFPLILAQFITTTWRSIFHGSCCPSRRPFFTCHRQKGWGDGGVREHRREDRRGIRDRGEREESDGGGCRRRDKGPREHNIMIHHTRQKPSIVDLPPLINYAPLLYCVLQNIMAHTHIIMDL